MPACLAPLPLSLAAQNALFAYSPFLLAASLAAREIIDFLHNGAFYNPTLQADPTIAHYGANLRTYFEQGAGGDVSLGADLLCEAVYAHYLLPFGEIDSEESGVITPRAPSSPKPQRRIILDPLDGSDNFLSHIPYYGASVALCEAVDSETSNPCDCERGGAQAARQVLQAVIFNYATQEAVAKVALDSKDCELAMLLGGNLGLHACGEQQRGRFALVRFSLSTLPTSWQSHSFSESRSESSLAPLTIPTATRPTTRLATTRLAATHLASPTAPTPLPCHAKPHAPKCGIFEKAYAHPHIAAKFKQAGLKFRSLGASAISLSLAHEVSFMLFMGAMRGFDSAAGLFICSDLPHIHTENFTLISKDKEIFGRILTFLSDE